MLQGCPTKNGTEMSIFGDFGDLLSIALKMNHSKH